MHKMKCRAMIDCSRGAVLTLDAVFFIIRTCALAGLNTLQLYTEDTYNINSEPFFGYLRGFVIPFFFSSKEHSI